MDSISEHPPSTVDDHTDTRSTDRRSEELYIRNFDVERTYNLTVTVKDSDGIVFTNRYHVKPGVTVSELNRLVPGEYLVQVELDGQQQAEIPCSIDESPDHTAVIEVGNGIVSVTEGLYQ